MRNHHTFPELELPASVICNNVETQITRIIIGQGKHVLNNTDMCRTNAEIGRLLNPQKLIIQLNVLAKTVSPAPFFRPDPLGQSSGLRFDHEDALRNPVCPPQCSDSDQPQPAAIEPQIAAPTLTPAPTKITQVPLSLPVQPARCWLPELP